MSPRRKSSEKNSDLVIPVMGSTGAGKSTFINCILGKDTMRVGHDVQSCTSDISSVEVNSSRLKHLAYLRGRRVMLVDTPGFDDTFKDDVDILNNIADWLKKSYSRDALCGVIYLHDISADRFTGTAKRNLRMFNKLCGDKVLGNAVLGLTKVARISREEAQKREDALKTRHWSDMIEKSVKVRKFSNSTSSDEAWEILKTVLDGYQSNLVLNIQNELVALRKFVPETEAGKELRVTLKEVLEIQAKYQQSAGNIEDATKQIELLRKQLKDLKVPLSKRIARLLKIF